MESPPPGANPGVDLATAAILAGTGIAGVVWAGAQLAAVLHTGHSLNGGLSDGIAAAIRLPSHAVDPRTAWPVSLQAQLPGPVLYWACTSLTLAATLALGVWVFRIFNGPRVGTTPRKRLGVDTRAHLARPRDLHPLYVAGPVRGRLILGHVHGRLVATEDRLGAPYQSRVSGRRRRAGDRSAVCVIGPARCGKTTNTIAGILEWQGPAILSSVKTDILGATLEHRRSVGDVRIFDPTRCTGEEQTACWSPLRAAGTVTGAQKAARALVDAAPRDGVDNIGFFQAMAKQLLWPLLYTAAVAGKNMEDVVRWVLTQDRLLGEEDGIVLEALDKRLKATNEAERFEAQLTLEAISAVWELDERTRGSTFATCQTMIDPWQDPAVATAAKACDIDLDWLLSGDGSNTLYLCAPTHEQARLSVVFGGLLGDLLQQAYEQASLSNQPIRNTLVVMDEAGNTPTRWLPPVASTCASIGLLLVTIWQSKAQIDAAYGALADSVLTNHGTKIIFSGISDPATIDYAARLLGDEELHQRTTSNDTIGGGRRSVTDGVTRLPLVPADLLRQIAPGEALLIHGTLRPAHLRARYHTG